MLSKDIQRVTEVIRVETLENKIYSGSVIIDRKMNITINNYLIKSRDVRYLILSDKEVSNILSNSKDSKNSKNSKDN